MEKYWRAPFIESFISLLTFYFLVHWFLSNEFFAAQEKSCLL